MSYADQVFIESLISARKEETPMLHFCVIVLFVPSKHVKKLIKRLLR